MRDYRLPRPALWALTWCVERYITGRAPDEQITIHGKPYMDRWKILPVNRIFNVFVHDFMHSDDDRAEHDHPWDNCSIVLRGKYLERFSHRDLDWKLRLEGDVVWRRATEKHRIVLCQDTEGNARPVLTIFIRFRKWREWGFWCKDGRWFHWRKFLADEDRSDWSLCETDLSGNVPGQGCNTGPDGDRLT